MPHFDVFKRLIGSLAIVNAFFRRREKHQTSLTEQKGPFKSYVGGVGAVTVVGPGDVPMSVLPLRNKVPYGHE